jgi:hypothetical protein
MTADMRLVLSTLVYQSDLLLFVVNQAARQTTDQAALDNLRAATTRYNQHIDAAMVALAAAEEPAMPRP